MAEETTDAEIEEVAEQTLVTGQQYSRPGFSKTNVPLSEVNRHITIRQARRRMRLGCTSVSDFNT